mgnify:CR=1 FL=1
MGTLTATYQPTYRPHGSRLGTLIRVLAVVVIGTALSHAVKHGLDAIAARECFDRHGQVQLWWNPVRNNFVSVCQDESGNIFLRIIKQIQGKPEEITAFRKDGYHYLEDLAKLLRDQGGILRWSKP